MKGILSILSRCACLLALLACTLPIPAQAVTVEPDVETHRLLGSLCALAAAANLHGLEGKGVPDPAHLERYFQRESLPEGWPDSVRVEARSESWWVGAAVGNHSAARKFLRSNAPELRVFDVPGGLPWMGAPFAWVEAVRFGTGKKPESFGLKAAEGYGQDKDALFFNAPPSDGYWWSPLRFTAPARAQILKRWGQKLDDPALTRPQERAAEKEHFKASPVGLPEEFNVSSDQEPGAVEMGDVLFNPIPRTRSD